MCKKSQRTKWSFSGKGETRKEKDSDFLDKSNSTDPNLKSWKLQNETGGSELKLRKSKSVREAKARTKDCGTDTASKCRKGTGKHFISNANNQISDITTAEIPQIGFESVSRCGADERIAENVNEEFRPEKQDSFGRGSTEDFRVETSAKDVQLNLPRGISKEANTLSSVIEDQSTKNCRNASEIAPADTILDSTSEKVTKTEDNTISENFCSKSGLQTTEKSYFDILMQSSKVQSLQKRMKMSPEDSCGKIREDSLKVNKRQPKAQSRKSTSESDASKNDEKEKTVEKSVRKSSRKKRTTGKNTHVDECGRTKKVDTVVECNKGATELIKTNESPNLVRLDNQLVRGRTERVIPLKPHSKTQTGESNTTAEEAKVEEAKEECVKVCISGKNGRKSSRLRYVLI